jgi:glycosyltransferase involved in cell wall biosynthesis
MKGRDFIITGLQPWDLPIGSNAIDIARIISRDNRVLYVNSALDHMTVWRNDQSVVNQHRMEVLKNKKENLRKISDSLWVLDFPFTVWSVNGLPDGTIFDLFNRLNNKKIFGYVRNKAGELNFRDYIHFIDNDIYRSFYSKKYLNPSVSVYYRRDNLLAFGWWNKHAGRLEPELIRKSDVVVCNSPQLAGYARSFNHMSFDVGQGVDLSAYDQALKFSFPGEFESIPGPRIGYIGDINSLRLDADLICGLAKSKPDYSFIMIGGEDKLFASHELHTLKNVYFTGSVHKAAVPKYMAALDICLNPQLLNEITNGNYPRKVDEYLAMGKPVIATKTATMELFRDHVYLCSGLAEYQDAIEKALLDRSEESAASRIDFARSHSWENNVNNIYTRINEFLQKQ